MDGHFVMQFFIRPELLLDVGTSPVERYEFGDVKGLKVGVGPKDLRRPNAGEVSGVDGDRIAVEIVNESNVFPAGFDSEAVVVAVSGIEVAFSVKLVRKLVREGRRCDLERNGSLA